MSLIEDLATSVKAAQLKYLSAEETVASAKKSLTSAEEAANKAFAEFNEAIALLTKQAQA